MYNSAQLHYSKESKEVPAFLNCWRANTSGQVDYTTYLCLPLPTFAFLTAFTLPAFACLILVRPFLRPLPIAVALEM